MDARFSIHVDAGRHLVRANLSGFFTVEDIARFVVVRDRVHRDLKCAQGEHVTVVDVRNMQIQSQESVAQFQRMLANPASQGRKIAFVVSLSLARMQAQRAAGERTAAYFSSVEAAEEWLFSDEYDAVPADEQEAPTGALPHRLDGQ